MSDHYEPLKGAQQYRLSVDVGHFSLGQQAAKLGVEGPGGAGAPPQTFFAELHNLLAELDHVIGSADVAASELRSRLFGPWPVAGEQASGANNLVTPTVCDAALETVRAITRRARGLSETAHVLEAKL